MRYQIYESADGHVLFMASEQAFWKNFCEGVGRIELFETWPGSKYADHARGNRELQAELRDIFKTKTSAEWIAFGGEQNTPIAPVNNAKTIGDDPQFQDRFPFFGIDDVGAEQLPLPVKMVGGGPEPAPTMAPTVGEHTDEVMAEVLGYDETRVAAAPRGRHLRLTKSCRAFTGVHELGGKRRVSQSTNRVLTASGFSSWTKWPACSMMCISRSEHRSGMSAAIAGGSAGSHSAHSMRQGRSSGLRPTSGAASTLASMFRYQLIAGTEAGAGEGLDVGGHLVVVEDRGPLAARSCPVAGTGSCRTPRPPPPARPPRPDRSRRA